MARQNLTDKTLKALKPAPAGSRYEIFDVTVPNMGVRVTDKVADPKTGRGRASFFLLARFPPSANPTRRALGEYPAMELAAARNKAREWLALLEKGTDPKVKIEDERRQREAEEAKKRDRSFETLLASYIAERRRDGLRKVAEDEMDFNRECLPLWRSRDVVDITMADILKVVGAIRDRGKQRQALNVAQKIGTFFNWCVEEELILVSPYRPKRVRNAVGERLARDRVLSDPELRALWRAAEGLGPVYGAAYRVLLLTGQRLNDIAQASWSEIDMDKRTLTVSAKRFKSDRDHVVPLTHDVVEILQRVPRYKGRGDWVFSLDGRHAASISDKVKRRLDAAMIAECRKLSGNEKAEIEPWVNHDLRRTVRTRLSELDILDEVAEALIGHMPSKLNRTYNHSDRLRVKLDALNRWQRELRRIVGETHGGYNVIQLSEARA